MTPAPDRRRVSRSLGWFYLGAPLLAEAWLALSAHRPAHTAAMVAICLLAQAAGALLARGLADDAPAAVLKALLTVASLFVAGLCLVSGSTDGFAYLFLWATPYAFVFGLRHAIVQGAFAALLLVGVHDLGDGDALVLAHAEHWLIPLATLGVVGAMVHRLTGELGRADRELLRGERERAEIEAARAASEAERARREAAMGRLGRMALRVPDRQALLDEAIALLEDTLDVDRCSIVEAVPGGERVRLAAGTTVAPDEDREDLPAAARRLVGWVLGAAEPIVVWEWASERRLDGGALRERGLRSMAAAAIRGRAGAFGVIAVHSSAGGAFRAGGADWLQSMADLLASALDREDSETRMRHQSLHDALTGLPNRSLFYDRVEHAFARAQRSGSLVAVFLLDVDQFKTINDSLGHEAGDDLLIALSARLQHVVRGSDTVARLGGDEFVVLCEIESESEAVHVAERIADAWERPIPVAAGAATCPSSSARSSPSPRRCMPPSAPPPPGSARPPPPPAARSSCPRASASRSRPAGRARRRCFARPTPRCTARRRAAAAATSCSTRRCASTPSRGCARSPTCAAPSSASSSASTTSRSSTSPPSGCSASRRSCAGTGRATGSSGRPSSSA